jgi:hypothetical protein
MIVGKYVCPECQTLQLPSLGQRLPAGLVGEHGGATFPVDGADLVAVFV